MTHTLSLSHSIILMYIMCVVVAKGINVKDDVAWSSVKGLKAGFVFMLIGQAGPLPSAPSSKTVFVEDLPEDQRAAAESLTPPGLVNLGNTCYMNSTVQALVAVPELRVALQKFRPAGASVDAVFTSQLAELSRELTFGGDSVQPDAFLHVLRQINPQFGERGEHGYAQQDADECLLTILQALSRQLTLTAADSAAAAAAAQSQSGVPNTVIHQLFGIEMDVTLRNTFNAAEPLERKRELVLKLAAHIDKETKFLTKCIELSLVGELEKTSSLTNSSAVYQKTSRLARLPLILTVQFVRFFWKAGADKKPGNKSKIVKPVEFPFTLDVLDFCSDELKAALLPARKKMRDREDARLGVKSSDTSTAVVAAAAAVEPSSSSTSTAAAASMAIDEPEGKKARTMAATSAFDNDTGVYELAALVTHKGRDADGGHYVAWVKEKDDQWLLYDDDRVSRVKDDDIKKLSGHGGGDWHMVYFAFYRAKRSTD
jgi:ubiquitin carboxyl-terminal hydrolase 14